MSGTFTPTFYEIPLNGRPQVFPITLAGNPLRLTFSYRDSQIGMGGWVMDVADSGGVPILCGVPLVTGANLLQQYDYLEFGGVLFVMTDGDQDAVPGFTTLGQIPGSHLYWMPLPGSPSP
jgi:hypothetical protein